MTLNTTNTGKIGGSGTLDANVNNTGTVYAADGTFEVTGNLSGTGVLESDASGDLRLDAGVTGQKLVFADPTAMVTVEQISNFAPTEIDGFGTGNAIDFAGQPNLVENFNTANSTLSLTIGDSTTPAATLKFVGATYSAGDFILSDDSHNGTLLSAPCFAAGTRIHTARGMVAVEDLRQGEMIFNQAGEQKPIVWIGRRRIDCRRHPRPEAVWPVRIAANAFAPGQPRRDLLLSPDHAVYTDKLLVPIRHLVNGASITQSPVDAVTYWHLELPAHDVILAEGLPAESYLDTGNRGAFANGGTIVTARPDFGRRVWRERGCAKLVLKGKPIERARRRLLKRAMELGFACTDDPNVRVFTEEGELPVAIEGHCHRVSLPVAARIVRIVSHTWIPAHMRPAENDYRRLGVAIAGLWLDRRKVSLASPGLSAGWHDPEPEWRWTDGDGELVLPGVRQLAFEVALSGTYWVSGRPEMAGALAWA